MKRKPVKSSAGYMLTSSGKIAVATRKGAQRMANKMARESSLSNVAGCTGTVCDCGDYYRINVGALPFAR